MRPIQVVAVLSLMSSMALGGGPRLTADRKPLPDAYERSLSIKMPLIGLRLGSLPEEACNKVWEIDSELQYVADTRHQMGNDGIDLNDYNYIGDGVAGGTRTALCVDGGRVKKMLIFKPGMTNDSAKQLMAKISSDAQGRPVQRGNGFVLFKMKGITFLIRSVGQWSSHVESTETVFMGQHHGTAAHDNSGPAAIEICVGEQDWQITTVSHDPKVIKAIQDEKLLKGMSEIEAFLAMRNHKLYRRHNGSEDNWVWSDKENVEGDTMVTSSSLGTSTTTWYTKKEKIVANALFKDGVLESFSDETLLNSPPPDAN